MKKNILLGVTGGIAAYKVVNVASSLTKKGFNVYVVMTEAATKFVSPLTFRTITQNPVNQDLFSPPSHYQVKHVSLAEKADIVLVAPATANFISKMASGIADDLLSTLITATRAPILVSPSMNINMYENTIIQENINKLDNRGVSIITPETGYLACGYEGKGRLPEPKLLVNHVIKELTPNLFKNKKILITAGPTREPLDPVRFLSNYSSGKMGYALAKAAGYRGATVKLISGPTNLEPPPGVDLEKIETAEEMNCRVKKYKEEQDIIIMSAAVSDFRPEKFNKNKIKKNKLAKNISLNSNPDILANIGQNKNENQILVGFAAESKNIYNNSRKKFKEKNLDLLIANDISQSGIGFGSDKNKVVIITEKIKKFLPVMSKRKIAELILNEIWTGFIN